MAIMMHQQSPFKATRHTTSTYFFNQAMRDPTDTIKFFPDKQARHLTYKPPLRAHILLIPIGTGHHWYLLIRTRHAYTFMDSLERGSTIISQAKRTHLAVIKNTPSHWAHPRGSRHFSPDPGFIQRDDHKFGVLLLIHI